MAGIYGAGFKLADDGVKLMTKSDRSGERVNTGIAFVRFKDADEAAVAAAAQHRKMMGNRYIECIPYTAPTVCTCKAVSPHSCTSAGCKGAWLLVQQKSKQPDLSCAAPAGAAWDAAAADGWAAAVPCAHGDAAAVAAAVRPACRPAAALPAQGEMEKGTHCFQAQTSCDVAGSL